MTPSRQVELVVEVSDADLERLEGVRGIPAVLERGAEGCTLVIVQSGAPDARAAEVHLDQLWLLVQPLLGELASVEATPSECVLRIIEYVGPNDRTGAGVPIDEKWVAAVARLGGSIDVDVYVEAESTDV